MSYGIHITNADGYVRIDEQFKRLAVVAQGQSAYNEWSGNYMLMLNTGTRKNGKMFIRPTSGEWVGAGAGAIFSQTPLPWVSIDTEGPFINHPGEHGLVVNAPNSERLFDSRNKIVCVDFVANIPLVDTSTVQTVTLPTPEYGVRVFNTVSGVVRRFSSGGSSFSKILSFRRNGETQIQYQINQYALFGVTGTIDQNYFGRYFTLVSGYVRL